MNFSITRSLDILERTPEVLRAQVSGLPDEWTLVNEGPGSWTVFDIAGHFVYIEKANWIPRAEIILYDSQKVIETLDPSGHLTECREKNLEELLITFKMLREVSIKKLKGFQLTESDFTKTAQHPALGTVNLSQLLATWVVHDLSHLAQISRVIAKQYRDAVGPFSEYLRIIQ